MLIRKSFICGCLPLFFLMLYFLMPPVTTAQTTCSVYDVSVACGVPGGLCDASAPSVTPTPEPNRPWIKVRTSSFYSNNFNQSPTNNYYVPVNPTPFRVNTVPGEEVAVEDTGDNRFMSADNTTITINEVSRRAFESGVARIDGTSFDPARINEKQWIVEGENARKDRLTPDTFLQYAQSRKDTVTVVSTGTNFQSGMTNGRVNIVDIQVGDTVTVTDGTFLESSPYVLVVDGNLVIGENFNETLSSNMAIIVTGTLTFEPDVTVANAIFFARQVEFPAGETDDSFGIRITGNLAVEEGIPQSSLQRQRTNNNQQPVVFIMQNLNMYLNILPLFSLANYEWQNVQ